MKVLVYFVVSSYYGCTLFTLPEPPSAGQAGGHCLHQLPQIGCHLDWRRHWGGSLLLPTGEHYHLPSWTPAESRELPHVTVRNIIYPRTYNRSVHILTLVSINNPSILCFFLKWLSSFILTKNLWTSWWAQLLASMKFCQQQDRISCYYNYACYWQNFMLP